MKAGIIGQIKGPFSSTENIVKTRLDSSGAAVTAKIGVEIDQKQWMKYGDYNKYPNGFYFILNNQIIFMGKGCIYQTDTPLNITTLVFPLGAPADTIIDYVIY